MYRNIIHVFTSHYEAEWDAELTAKMMAQLPESSRKSVERGKTWEQRQGSLARKMLLLHGLKHVGYEDENPLEHISFAPSGKPYLENGPYFSVSNDTYFAVCCVSEISNLGLDVERIKPIDLSQFRDKMTFLEWREIYSHVIPIRRFYEFWTVKESVIKAISDHKNIDLEEIYIRPEVVFCRGQYWYPHPIELDYSYICHVISDKPDVELMVHEIDLPAKYS